MRVVMQRIYASPRGTCDEGKEIDLPVAEARGLIAGGYARLAAGELDDAPETAMHGGGHERAVKTKAKAKEVAGGTDAA